MIKKHLTHKILPVLALFLLILNLFLVSRVNASNDVVNLSIFDRLQAILLYDKINSKYVLLEMFINNHSCNGRKFYVVSENDTHISLHGLCDHGSFYTYTLYTYNAVNGSVIDVIDNRSLYSSGIPLDKSQYSFVYSNSSIYSDSSCIDLSTSDYFNTFTKPRFGDTKESISNLTAGYCLIFPRRCFSESND